MSDPKFKLDERVRYKGATWSIIMSERFSHDESWLYSLHHENASIVASDVPEDEISRVSEAAWDEESI